MKIQELRDKTQGERQTILVELSDKARKLRFDLSTREAKNHREYRKMKKDIARILTIHREEEVQSSFLDREGENK